MKHYMLYLVFDVGHRTYEYLDEDQMFYDLFQGDLSLYARMCRSMYFMVVYDDEK